MNKHIYTVSLAVDGRLDVKIMADSFEEAKERAENCAANIDIKCLDVVSKYRAVNAERDDGEFRDY